MSSSRRICKFWTSGADRLILTWIAKRAGGNDIDGILIRDLRKRLGMTQRQLAEQLHVDQGTISRWERGVEAPRPSRQLELQTLLMRDHDRRAMQRALAFIEQDLLPSTLLDSQLRLIALSASAREHILSRGKNPDALIGMSLDRYSDRFGAQVLLKHFARSGFMDGDCLFLRFVQNYHGRGHVTVYEPVLEDGRVVGVLNFVTKYFEFSGNQGNEIEAIEIIPTGDPSKATLVHSGPNANEAIRALQGAKPVQ
ncbi:MAG: helix-turn-helix transcriptional regulator [Rhodobacteraceae bacterium]|nr:helix-turn-helix transcriptional regulator [Paracoccaceae bacterium]